MSKQRNAALAAKMTGATADDDPVLPKATRKAPTPSPKAAPPSARRLTAQLSGEVWAVLDTLPRSVSAAAFIRAAVLAVAADRELMDDALDEAHADAKRSRSRAHLARGDGADITTS